MTGSYVQLLMQEMMVKVEVGFLLSLLAVFKFKVADDREEFEQTLKKFNEDVDSIKQSLVSEVRQSELQSLEHLYDYVHLSPIKVCCSPALSL